LYATADHESEPWSGDGSSPWGARLPAARISVMDKEGWQPSSHDGRLPSLLAPCDVGLRAQERRRLVAVGLRLPAAGISVMDEDEPSSRDGRLPSFPTGWLSDFCTSFR